MVLAQGCSPWLSPALLGASPPAPVPEQSWLQPPDISGEEISLPDASRLFGKHHLSAIAEAGGGIPKCSTSDLGVWVSESRDVSAGGWRSRGDGWYRTHHTNPTMSCCFLEKRQAFVQADTTRAEVGCPQLLLAPAEISGWDLGSASPSPARWVQRAQTRLLLPGLPRGAAPPPRTAWYRVNYCTGKAKM